MTENSAATLAPRQRSPHVEGVLDAVGIWAMEWLINGGLAQIRQSAQLRREPDGYTVHLSDGPWVTASPGAPGM